MIFLKLFLTFFKIGAFTFGGGYAMLPLITEEVLNNKWLAEEAIVNFIAVSESTPGPFAVNIATYVGGQLGGIFGSACATLGVVLPSFIIILIVAKCFEKFKNSSTVEGCMKGLRPAVIGLIGTAIMTVGKTALFPKGVSVSNLISYEFICSLVIFAVSAFLVFKKKLHPIAVIIIAAAFGIVAGYGQMII